MEVQVTTFNDREKAHEKKFVLDAELQFRAEQRRNKALAEWAGARMGLSGDALAAYVSEVRKADLAEKGDEDVFRKVKSDLEVRKLGLPDSDLRKYMQLFLEQAIAELRGTAP
jgi:hypothetical protein